MDTNTDPQSIANKHATMRAKLVALSQEEFFDHEGMATDYPAKVRAAFTELNNELGVILKGTDVSNLDDHTLDRFTEKVDELKFLLGKI